VRKNDLFIFKNYEKTRVNPAALWGGRMLWLHDKMPHTKISSLNPLIQRGGALADITASVEMFKLAHTAGSGF
jgi:hypothetical protein